MRVSTLFVSRLLESQDKVLRSYFAQKGGARSQRGKGFRARVGYMGHICVKREQIVYVDPS